MYRIKLKITFKNGGGNNVSLNVDGKDITGNIIPLFNDKKEHNIIAVIK
jgi:hypothetical protein